MPETQTEQVLQMTLEELDAIKDNVPDDVFLNATYASFPSIWMENMLKDPQKQNKPLILREYQRRIADDHSRKKILRMGRQLGKSLLLCALALWRAICFPGSKVIIVTPRESQLQNIVSIIRNFIATAHPSVKVVFNKMRAQPVQMVFHNGSIIRGFVVSTESATSGGSTIRGQSASDLFIDETDYIDDDAMMNAIMPTVTNFPHHNIWMSSTPTGRVGFFYNTWFSGEYTTYHYASSASPMWTEEMEARIARLDTATREHEYLANFFTGDTSVFKTELIQAMQDRHSKIISDKDGWRNYSYKDKQTLISRSKYRFVGVDWNKKHGTRIIGMVVLESGKLAVVFKERIDFSMFQFHVAIQRLRQIDASFNPNFICVDVGHGDMQIEELRLASVKDPSNPIGKKVVAVRTDSTIEIVDVFTGTRRQTYVKNFAVKSAVRCLEQGILILPEDEFMSNEKKQANYGDISIADQMRNYYIEKINYSGREMYKCRSDHDLDAMMFAIYGYVTQILKINNLYDLLPATHAMIVAAREPRSLNANRMSYDGDRIPEGATNLGMPLARGIYGRATRPTSRNIPSRTVGLGGRQTGGSGTRRPGTGRTMGGR